MDENQDNKEAIDEYLMIILWHLVECDLLTEKEAMRAKKIYLEETRDHGQKK